MATQLCCEMFVVWHHVCTEVFAVAKFLVGTYLHFKAPWNCFCRNVQLFGDCLHWNVFVGHPMICLSAGWRVGKVLGLTLECHNVYPWSSLSEVFLIEHSFSDFPFPLLIFSRLYSANLCQFFLHQHLSGVVHIFKCVTWTFEMTQKMQSEFSTYGCCCSACMCVVLCNRPLINFALFSFCSQAASFYL